MRTLTTIALLLFAQIQEPSDTGIIEGRVTRFETKAGLSNVEITLTVDGIERSFRLPDVVTDAGGRFILRDIVPGKYVITARRGGYVHPAPGGVRLQDGGSTRTITLRPGQHVDDANLSLAFGGIIAGTISDSNGKPVAGAPVIAEPIATTASNSTVRSETNDRGEYRIVGVETGKYHVIVRSSSVTTYFPGVADKAQASILAVSENAVLTGNDFIVRVQGRFTISGQVISQSSSFGQSHIPYADLVRKGSAKAPRDIVYNTAQSPGDANHLEFEFRDISPGSYDLFLDIYDKRTPELRGYGARASVEVTDRNISGLRIVAGSVSVKGRLVSLGDAPDKLQGTVELELIPEAVRTADVKAGIDGSFTIPSVLSGTWKVLVSNLPRDRTVFDVRQGGRSIYESGLSVGESAPDPFEILVSPAETIEGAVQDSGGRTVSGAHVILLPSSPNESIPALYRETVSDAAGRFTFSAVAAGSYTLLAIEMPATQDSQKPDLRTLAAPYLSRGATVTIAAGAPRRVTILLLR